MCHETGSRKYWVIKAWESSLFMQKMIGGTGPFILVHGLTISCLCSFGPAEASVCCFFAPQDSQTLNSYKITTECGKAHWSCRRNDCLRRYWSSFGFALSLAVTGQLSSFMIISLKYNSRNHNCTLPKFPKNV